VAHAVDHLRELAHRITSIDTSRVVLMGHSAGGQLALWAASRGAGNVPGASLGPTPTLRAAGAVSLAGITDLATYGAGTGNCNAAVSELLGGTPVQVPERYRDVSPVERIPLGVPVRLVHGDADPTVSLAQSEAYAERARAAGDQVALSAVKGAGHFDVIAPQARAWSHVVEALHALAGLRDEF
jgi:acetyl esterase/lipase